MFRVWTYDGEVYHVSMLQRINRHIHLYYTFTIILTWHDSSYCRHVVDFVKDSRKHVFILKTASVHRFFLAVFAYRL